MTIFFNQFAQKKEDKKWIIYTSYCSEKIKIINVPTYIYIYINNYIIYQKKIKYVWIIKNCYYIFLIKS
jgi:hypothetical protein